MRARERSRLSVRTLCAAIIIAAVVACLAAPTRAGIIYTWNGGSGNWNTTTSSGWNTSSGDYPRAAGDTVNVTFNIGSNQNLSINVANAIAGAVFIGDPDGTKNWTLSATSTNKLTLDNGSGNATLTKNNDTGGQSSGTDTISAPIQLNSNLVISNLSTTTKIFDISGAISGSGKTITVASTSVGVISIDNASNVVGTSTSGWIVNGATLLANAANVFNGQYVKVNSGGIFTAVGGTDNVLAGTTSPTIELAGGTFSFDNVNSSGHENPGGNFLVSANSAFKLSNGSSNNTSRTTTFGTLDFGAGSPTLTTSDPIVANTVPMTAKFVNSFVDHSGTISTGTHAAVELNGLVVVAGQPITKAGTDTLTLSGQLGVRLPGSAALMTSNSVTLVSRSAGTLAYSSLTMPDNSSGLWNYSQPPTNTNLAVTLAAASNKATFSVGGSAAFASTTAGFATISGWQSNLPYYIDLDLAGSFTLSNVIAQLQQNPAFSSVTALSDPTYDVRIALTTPGSMPSTDFFAWDNTAGHSLGANVQGIRVELVPEPATAAILGCLCLLGAARPRRRR